MDSKKREEDFLQLVEMASSVPHHTLLKLSVDSVPDATALVDVPHNKRCTYTELWQRTNKLGNIFLELGLERGDHIAYFADDGIETVELFFGASKTGTVWTILNARFKGSEAFYQIDHSDAKLVIVGPGHYLDIIKSIQSDLTNVKHFLVLGDETAVPADMKSFNSMMAQAPDHDPPVEVTAEDWDSLAYTSGTTGKPSGSLRTHRSGIQWELVASQGRRLGDSTPIFGEGDVVKNLSYYPFYHWGGPVSTRPVLASGGTKYIVTGCSAKQLLEVIEKEQISAIAMIPVVTARLLAEPDVEKYDLSCVQSWSSSGAALSVPVREKLVSLMPNASFNELYSSTEGLFAMGEFTYLKNKVRSSGLPPFGIETKILDNDYNELPLGEVGLIYNRGLGVHNEYYKNEEKNRKSRTPDGEWFTCEDMGFMDEDGHIFVADRAKDVINTAGELVQSLEIEDILLRHHKINEVAVVSSPDPIYQEIVTAVIVLMPGETATSEEFKEWSRDKMASFKIPRRVEIVDEIPKTGPEKVDKKKIREWFWKKDKFKV